MSDEVAPIKGWLLLSKDECSNGWYIAWYDMFGTKKSALKFARENNWPNPFKAVRGTLSAALSSPHKT